MTNKVELQHQAAIAKQKRWLKERRKVGDPCAALSLAILTQNHNDIADARAALEAVLVARQQLIDAIATFFNACKHYRTALRHARNVEHYVRGSHRKLTPIPLRDAAQTLRREPGAIARWFFKGVPGNLVRLMRRTPGAKCPACEHVIGREKP